MDFNPARVIALVALAYLCYLILLFIFQRQMLYPGRSIRVAEQPPTPTEGLDQIWIETAGSKVEAWFLPAKGVKPGEKRPAVLFFHGNGEVIDDLPDQVKPLRGMGCGVMLVEYPGYGRSGGKPSYESIMATAQTAFDILKSRNDVNSFRIMAFGRSLGAGVACELTRRRPVASLVLQSPFTSTRDFAHRFLAPKFLVRDTFDSRSAIPVYQGPTLIFHGRRDDIIPFKMGKELAGLSKNGQFIELDCAHNDCPQEPREFWRMVEAFYHMQAMF